MGAKEQERVRNLFSDANRQMAGARRAQIARIEQARAMRRFRIMREAGRLMSESRNLQQIAELEGIPLKLPFQHSAPRKQWIPMSKERNSELNSSWKLAKEIVNLIGDIEKAEKEEKIRNT